MRCCLLLAAAALASIPEAAALQQNETRYGIIIDAGSEGSRVVVYQWKANRTGWTDRHLTIPVAIANFSIVPGIGSFALRPEMAGPSLEPLMNFSKQHLRHVKDDWHRYPVYLRATAGMRLLHADEREAVLDNVRGYFRQQPFMFEDDYAMVITGEEEGIFGWITVNDEMGSLQEASISSGNTFGALDLGGASTQMVFIPEKSIMSQAFPVQLGPHHVRVYSWSFLHFGEREAAHRAADVIISKALNQVQSVSEIHHPCYNLGFVYTPNFGYSDNRTFPMTVEMKGSASFEKCESIIMQTFQKHAPCLVQSCSFYGVYQPHVYSSKFIGFSHFAQIAEALALPVNARLLDLRIAAEYVCSLSKPQIDTIFFTMSEFTRSHLCFHATFVYVLLTFGYGFDPSSRQIIFKHKFDDGRPIDYIHGAMIYQLNQDPMLTVARETHHERKEEEMKVWL